MPKFKVEHDVSDETITDILTNMVESGASGYWAYITDVVRSDNLDVKSFGCADNEVLEEAIEETGSLEAAKHGNVDTVTPQSVVDAIQKMLETRPVNDYIMRYIEDGVSEDDAGHFDGEACDALLQIILLDGIVYG